MTPSVEQYAAVLRKDYRQRCGYGAHRDYGHDMPDWCKVAQHVISLKADPVAFMDAAFQYAGNHLSKQSVHRTGAPFLSTMKSFAWCQKAWMHANPQQFGMAADAPEFSCAPEEEWRLMQQTAFTYFMRLYKKIDLFSPEIMQELREPFCNLHPVARGVLSANDPEVLRLYGKAAYDYLWRRQAMKKLIESEGFVFVQLPANATDATNPS